MFSSILFPVHKDGWYFILPAAFITYIAYKFSATIGFPFLVITVWCYFFFRNPKRMVPQKDGLIVSPADGKVSAVVLDTPPLELGLDDSHKWWRISIFLNIFNVHVNRIPLKGTVQKVMYHPGKFVNASLDKASKDNERNSLLISTSQGFTYACTQIAGLVARRIRCDVKVGDQVKTGAYFGLIRFGSRLDIYIPERISPLVIEGQTAVAGETILADLDHKSEMRRGEWQ